MGQAIGFAAVALLLLAPSLARAATYTWGVPTGDWSIPGNWGGTLPTANDDAFITSAATATVSTAGATCNNLRLDSAVGAAALQLTAGSLYTTNQYVGYSGTGVLSQSGGTNSLSNGLCLGYGTGANGSYNLTGGSLAASAGSEVVGGSGTGTFTQSGGTNSAWGLYLGSDSGGSGTYNLSQAGVLSTAAESVGAGYNVPVLFQQTGGSNSAYWLTMGGSNDRYVLSGGTLQVNGGLQSSGVFDGGGGTGTLSVGPSAIADFSRGSLVNAASMSVAVAPDSLLIVPANFDLTKGFGALANSGMVHVAGGTLSVAPGQGFCGYGSINDFVSCQGTVAALVNGTLSLSGGLYVSGAGSVSLGNGTLAITGAASGMSGGSLSAGNETLGGPGYGTFTQSGGSNTVGSLSIYGTYMLTGGTLNAGTISGGSLIANGGCWCASNGISGALGLASSPGLNLSYSLGGATGLCSGDNYVGHTGTATLAQSAGTQLAGTMYLGCNPGSSGSYSLTGGSLGSATPLAASSMLATAAAERSRSLGARTPCRSRCTSGTILARAVPTVSVAGPSRQVP